MSIPTNINNEESFLLCYFISEKPFLSIITELLEKKGAIKKSNYDFVNKIKKRKENREKSKFMESKQTKDYDVTY